ncbi:glycosyltransferase family 4 protein [Malikia granosa]|uniref:glycosyltransferase family 4 protein n=1 Tax=Malikia granosa TaxID=263067 RepID=UPI0011B04EDB|nr:glycosyltransferase family 4 protein [Malikia granosa]
MPKNSKKNKIFLLTSAEPNRNGIGSIFINDIINKISDVDIIWNFEAPFLLNFSIAGHGIISRSINSTLIRLRSWQNLRFSTFLNFELKNRVNKIEKEIIASGSKLIWTTTSSPELICITALLAERGHDIRVTVWDAPEYLLHNLGFSKRNCEILESYFKRLMSKANAATVVSENMRQIYSDKFPRLKLYLMQHGIAPINTTRKSNSENSIKIIFAGSLYAKDEWNAFIEAIENSNWKISGHDINIIFAGRFPLKGAARPSRLKLYSPMPQNEAIMLMSQMDIGYLPYWLHPDKEFVARTSFPGKMTAYSAAGLSIFHHGPRSSSVTGFLEKYPYGIACDSLDPKIILKQLEQLIKNTASEEHIQVRSQAIQEALSDDAMINAFRQLTALSPTAQMENCIK